MLKTHLQDAENALRCALAAIEAEAEDLWQDFMDYREAAVNRARDELKNGTGTYFALVLYYVPSEGEKSWTLRWHRADRVPGARGKKITRYHAIASRGSGKTHLQTLLAAAGDGHEAAIEDFEAEARRLRMLQRRYRDILIDLRRPEV